MTGSTALAVDDEAPLVTLVRSYLEREGFEVTTAADGEHAVELVRELAPDKGARIVLTLPTVHRLVAAEPR